MSPVYMCDWGAGQAHAGDVREGGESVQYIAFHAFLYRLPLEACSGGAGVDPSWLGGKNSRRHGENMQTPPRKAPAIRQVERGDLLAKHHTISKHRQIE